MSKKKLIIIKRAMIKNHHPLYGVDNVTILEPFENIYKRIVCIMKQSTQEYYNMRMVLGLKCL